MSVFQRYRETWQRLQEYVVTKNFPPETAPVVNQYADEAYRFCVRLFGPPVDPKRLYKVVQGERSFHSLSLGTHMIIIARQAASKEQLCEVIAHEMCHRVTAGRKGLAGELWIKELMATLTSRWFLQHQGFNDCAEWIRKRSLATDGVADLNLLRNSSPGSRRYVLSGEPVYSEAFIESLWRTGYALEKAVMINDLFSLARANTLQEWITSLPQEDQYVVCRVLELPIENKAIPYNDREVGRLFLALQAKGDKEALVAEFEQLAQCQPENSTTFFHLGYAYQVAKRPDEAIIAYLKASELGYSDKWLLYNIGSVYWQTEDYAPAAEWFQKAVQQTPDWAQPRYFLGRSLNNLGNIGGARQAWEKVLTLDDEQYAKLAQKALEANPLLPGSRPGVERPHSTTWKAR